MGWNRLRIVGGMVAVGAGTYLAAACSGDHAHVVQQYANMACKITSDDSVISAAVRGYIAQTTPLPKRFLFIPATDSSPPDAAVEVFKSLGPTYMYSSIPAQQAIVNKKLDDVGDYPTLLMAYHGMVRTDPLHPIVTLSGHFVTGEDSGTVVAERKIALGCDSTGWVVPKVAAPALASDSGVVITKNARLAKP